MLGVHITHTRGHEGLGRMNTNEALLTEQSRDTDADARPVSNTFRQRARHCSEQMEMSRSAYGSFLSVFKEWFSLEFSC